MRVPDPFNSSEYFKEGHTVSLKVNWYGSNSFNPGVRGLRFMTVLHSLFGGCISWICNCIGAYFSLPQNRIDILCLIQFQSCPVDEVQPHGRKNSVNQKAQSKYKSHYSDDDDDDDD